MPGTYDDAETLVQSRRLADEIARELDATTLSRPIPYIPPPLPPALEPEELLPSPPLPPSNIYETAWSNVSKTASKRRKARRRRKVRSQLHWAVVAMALAIVVGLWRDPAARANAKRQLTAETQRVVKLVSARII